MPTTISPPSSAKSSAKRAKSTKSTQRTKRAAASKNAKRTAAPKKKTVRAAVKKVQTNTISSAYELQKRTRAFASNVRLFVSKLPRAVADSQDGQQLLKASGTLGATCIEGGESPTRKAFLLNMKICRRETKECIYWLDLLDQDMGGYVERRRKELLSEAHDLRRVYTAICKTTESNDRQREAKRIEKVSAK